MLEKKINIEVCYISKTKTHLVSIIVDNSISVIKAIYISNISIPYFYVKRAAFKFMSI